MKLIRFGAIGDEKPGLYIDKETILDLSGFGEDYNEEFFNNDGLNRLQNWVKQNNKSLKAINPDIRIGPPVCRPSKIICIGLNFLDHAKESGVTPPTEPIIFFKSTTSICGPFENLVIPKNAKKTDWEVELAIVINKKAKYISEKDTPNYIAGYLLHNDYSEREYQLEREGQWVKGKSCDTFAPIGPYLVTKDEIKDINNLNMWLKVNGNYMQRGNTCNFIFQISYLVSYITQFMTLLPGDIISTGTPAGVGLGMNPPCFLKPGDIVELGIDNLGFSRQRAVSHER